MTKLSSANQTKLNKSMKAAQNVDLGTLLATMESGSATAATDIATLQGNATVSAASALTAVHTNASAITLDTTLGTIAGYVATVTKSGSAQMPYVNNSSGSLVFAANTTGSYVMEAGDIVSYIAW